MRRGRSLPSRRFVHLLLEGQRIICFSIHPEYFSVTPSTHLINLVTREADLPI